MKKQVFNPYLPLNTYIPDGEPHVFGDRLYIFGSHDKEGGNSFCSLPYECWSAPVDDLTDFRCEGTIYSASDDPTFGEEFKAMYAPDVVQGNDGRYYLYYAMAGGELFTGPIHVAVSDTPGGKYQYYGEVRNPDGSTMNSYITFDPAVMNDDGHIRLYYGWSFERYGAGTNIPEEQLLMAEKMIFKRSEEEILSGEHTYMGANTVELEDDMLTIKGDIKRIVPGQFASENTSFVGHAFFEASSIRKINDTYYFIYSAQELHELCYATSRYPDKDFVFGGTIVSNGDIGLNGATYENPLFVIGNNHGSICEIKGQYYIFYHRHTHKNTFSRQGCAEKITIDEDGKIKQAEITSAGLNPGPLEGEGTYPAAICCNLTNGKLKFSDQETNEDSMPHIANDGPEHFVAEIDNGTLIGYKYFEFAGNTRITLTVRGNGSGVFKVRLDENEVAVIDIQPSEKWTTASAKFNLNKVCALYLVFEGDGSIELKDIGFKRIIE